MKIFLLTALFPLSALAAPGDAHISANVFGSPLVITTTSRLAGAIASLTWNGREFINQDDHGRELQSASSFDGFGECFNPTEAGSGADGSGSASTSRLLGISASGNVLATSTNMAFWTPTGSAYPQGCGGNASITRAQNTVNLSGHILSKRVTIGYAGIPNAIEYLETFHVPEHHGSATFEALTGYMPKEFSAFYSFDPFHRTLVPLTPGPGEQNLPVILSTADQRYAMGIYSPDLPQAQFPGAGYGRFDFSSGNTMKWNAVFRRGETPPGDYSFQEYVLVGSLQQVMASMSQVYAHFNPGATPAAPPVPSPLRDNFRFFNTAHGHFVTANYAEGIGAGYTYEGVAFRSARTGAGIQNPKQLFRCFTPMNGHHFVSANANCEGGRLEGDLGFVSGSPAAGLVPLFRLFNGASDHLVSVNQNEGAASGYHSEGVLGYVVAPAP